MISQRSLEAVFKNSLKLKPQESCLIVTDIIKEEIAKEFYEYAQKISPKTKMVVMNPTREHGQEPPRDIAQSMLDFDVQLLITAKSLSHTMARREATGRGARIASLPTITEEIINRSLDVDYHLLRKEARGLARILSQSKEVRVITPQGTDIVCQRGERRIMGTEGGCFDYKGAFGNLPEGEVSFAPVNAHGVYVVDASFPDLGKLSNPLTFKVRKGYVTEIEGQRANQVKTRLEPFGKKAFLVAELGIGLNPKAILTGNVLEDEKVRGTAHIALGNNLSFGGHNDVPLHLDGVMSRPTIYGDEKRIMIKGRILNG
jgi:leucyl aminopeptidase (aminopeptidase T)